MVEGRNDFLASCYDTNIRTRFLTRPPSIRRCRPIPIYPHLPLSLPRGRSRLFETRRSEKEPQKTLKLPSYPLLHYPNGSWRKCSACCIDFNAFAQNAFVTSHLPYVPPHLYSVEPHPGSFWSSLLFTPANACTEKRGSTKRLSTFVWTGKSSFLENQSSQTRPLSILDYLQKKITTASLSKREYSSRAEMRKLVCLWGRGRVCARVKPSGTVLNFSNPTFFALGFSS